MHEYARTGYGQGAFCESLGLRRSGLACGLVSRLTREIAGLGKTPFYSTWAGNMGSTKTALKCGFFPAWLSMQVIPKGAD